MMDLTWDNLVKFVQYVKSVDGLWTYSVNDNHLVVDGTLYRQQLQRFLIHSQQEKKP